MSDRPTLSVLVCKSGQFIVRPATGAPEKLILPLNLASDPRLFVRNGEIVRPFQKVEFAFVQTAEVSGMQLHLYGEVSSGEFDPTGLTPIEVRSLDKDFEQLNA